MKPAAWTQHYLIYLVRQSPARSNSSRDGHLLQVASLKPANASRKEGTNCPNLSLKLARTRQDPPPSNENFRNSSEGFVQTSPLLVRKGKNSPEGTEQPEKTLGGWEGAGERRWRVLRPNSSCGLHSQSLKRSYSKLGLQAKWRSRKGRGHRNLCSKASPATSQFRQAFRWRGPLSAGQSSSAPKLRG